MKLLNSLFARISFVIMLTLTNITLFAQDKGVDINIGVKKETQWYAQPWVWIVGGAVFILLLVALLRKKE
jgi:hypothetical protein